MQHANRNTQQIQLHSTLSANLRRRWNDLYDVYNSFFEASIEHLIRLVNRQESEPVQLKSATLYHVVYATRGTNDDVNTGFYCLYTLANGRSANKAGQPKITHVHCEGSHHGLYGVGKFADGLLG